MTASSSEELPWRRNVSDVARGLAQWVEHEFGKDAVLGDCTMPENGMANESVIFDIGQDRYVARLAPHQDTPYPTFPVFDLRLQRDLMELVRIRTNVPVPEVVRYEEDPEWLGTPFLVMRHIEGEVPRDSPPYVVQGWMTTLTAVERAQLEENTIGLLARIHTVRDPADFELFADYRPGDPSLRRLLSSQQEYYEWAREGLRVPAIEEAFTVLGSAVPENERKVLNWGDSRIGNIIYRGPLPVAVLDWEMATVGPPEVDVAWMLFMHMFLQDMIAGHGMPELFRRHRVVDLYQKFSGEKLDDLSWYLAFAGLRFAIILLRMGLRASAFGKLPPSNDADSTILFAPLLRNLISEVPG